MRKVPKDIVPTLPEKKDGETEHDMQRNCAARQGYRKKNLVDISEVLQKMHDLCGKRERMKLNGIMQNILK